MKIHQTLALSAYPAEVRVDVLETFFEAQVRVNTVYLIANPETPNLYEARVRYRREGLPEQWKDIPTILRDGFDDCEGLSCWLAAELRARGGVHAARVQLTRGKQHPNLLHAIVSDGENPRRRWDPSKVLGMAPRRKRRRRKKVA